MPKNKPKKGKGRNHRNGMMSDLLKASDSAPQSQDEDNLSEISHTGTGCSENSFGDPKHSVMPIGTSSGCSDHGNEDNTSEGVGEVSPIEVIEEKLKEAIEGLTEKNAKYRKECLDQIRKCFLSNWLVEFLENYKETLLDGLEKCLRKGKGDEQALAAELIAVLTIQTGGEEGETLFTQFKPFLTRIVLDQSSAVIARSKCCQALGILAFISAEDIDEIVSCVQSFESVFRGSYLKGDKSVPVVTPLVSEFHSYALSSWSLLLSITPWTKVKEIAENCLSRLPELLTSNNVELRITTGETIALFYEIFRSENAENLMPRLLNKRKLIEDLKELATDSNKHRAKKDRKQQRSSFREIVRAVETGEQPDDQVKFGAETLFMETWTIKRQYSSMKDILTTGINLHLKKNILLRDIFQLGAPILDTEQLKGGQSSHFERHLYNQAAFKARSKARGKLRDKRTSFRT